MTGIVILAGQASSAQVTEHLVKCDSSFIPPLSSRVNIAEYAKKVTQFALCIEGWHDATLVGLLCIYCNDDGGAFVTNVSVLPLFRGKGVADMLMKNAIEKVREKGIGRIRLEVDNANVPATCLYRRYGFSPDLITGQTTMMLLNL